MKNSDLAYKVGGVRAGDADAEVELVGAAELQQEPRGL
jgi:hypothetical protein